MADAMADFNSAEIKTAIADSDLRGLNQLKSAMDVQDTKNAVEYFHQPSQRVSRNKTSEVSLGELSEEFKEAEKGIDPISKPKSESSNSGTASKYVINIPDGTGSAKNNDDAVTMETINEITENAEQLFTSKAKDIENDSTKKDIKNKNIMEAARIIENLIEKDATTRSNPTYKPTQPKTTKASTKT